MEEVSDSFLDLLRLQAGLLWVTVPNDLKRRSGEDLAREGNFHQRNKKERN